MSINCAAIILAAGKGKRMKSDLPKVLHPLDGRPIILYLLENISKIGIDNIVVVVGFQGEMVADAIKKYNVDIVWQKELLGTGHAVSMTEKNFADYKGTVLVAAGDVPFLSDKTITGLVQFHQQNKVAATCLSTLMDDPTDYGRIIRQPDSDILLDIIEEKDANEKIRKIKEINSGTFCFESIDLFPALSRIENNNAQKEFYLTDTIRVLRQEGKKCSVRVVSDPFEVKGINSVEQLRSLENEWKRRKDPVKYRP
jgi:UDP-N-acetylglucosamine diphosphorylase/glucosamine-1-phosphate N-acetyltransferase